MRKLAYIFSGIAMVLAGMTLFKTNLLASDGKKMQEMLTELRQAEEEAGKLEQEMAEAKSLRTVAARAEELGFTQATVKRIEGSDQLAKGD